MELRERIDGQVIYTSDSEYEQIRRGMVWNALKPGRRPEIIVRAASEDDALEVVRYAGENGMKIAVRGGGHSWCGSSMRDGGILLDLSMLNNVEIDADNGIAAAGPGVTNREFARRLRTEGLAFPFGHCGSVALGGYVLGGGIGWNWKAWGLACSNLVALEAVTADGRDVRASADENSELLWAARGSGPGFFAAATKYYLRLHPLPRAITTSTLIFPLSATPEVVEWTEGIAGALPPWVEMTLIFGSTPPHNPEEREKVCIVTATAFADTQNSAKEALSPLADCPVDGCMMKILEAATPFDALFDMIDSTFRPGMRYAVDTMWFGGDAHGVLTALARRFAEAPSPDSAAIVLILPGSPESHTGLTDGAFSMTAPVFVSLDAIWDDEARDGENVAWVRSTMDELGKKGVGHFISETDLTVHPSRASGSFSPASWKRIQELRKKYDPDGIFHNYLGHE